MENMATGVSLLRRVSKTMTGVEYTYPNLYETQWISSYNSGGYEVFYLMGYKAA
jgi:hypothetical protein